MVRYLADETAGQCGPCMFGLPALADAVTDLAYAAGRGRAIDQITSLVSLIEGRGACRHPDGATQLVRSALWAFEADARWHDHRGPCAGVRRAPLLPVPGDDDGDWLDDEDGQWPGDEDWPGDHDEDVPGYRSRVRR